MKIILSKHMTSEYNKTMEKLVKRVYPSASRGKPNSDGDIEINIGIPDEETLEIFEALSISDCICLQK